MLFLATMEAPFTGLTIGLLPTLRCLGTGKKKNLVAILINGGVQFRSLTFPVARYL